MAELYYEKSSCSGNNLEFIDEMTSNMVDIIVEYGSDDFWRLLKYPSKDAPTKPAVTPEERVQLVKDGFIRRVAYANDISTTAHSELRIYPYKWDVRGVNDYSVRIGFDIITHNSLIELVDGRTSGMVMTHEILDLFNGAVVGKNVGAFTVDGMSGTIIYYNSEYQGYRFYLLGKSS